MSLHLIIDGYNLIRQAPDLSRLDARDIQEGRSALLAYLASYRKTKKHKITVVFDGWKGSNSYQESRDIVKGINVVFSPMGVTADEVIKRLARQHREQSLVVSSDREIINYAEAQHATTISSLKFLTKLERALYAVQKGGDSTQTENDCYWQNFRTRGSKKKRAGTKKIKEATSR